MRILTYARAPERTIAGCYRETKQTDVGTPFGLVAHLAMLRPGSSSTTARGMSGYSAANHIAAAAPIE